MTALALGFILLCLAVFAVWVSTFFYVVLAVASCGAVALAIPVIAWIQDHVRLARKPNGFVPHG